MMAHHAATEQMPTYNHGYSLLFPRKGALLQQGGDTARRFSLSINLGFLGGLHPNVRSIATCN